MPGRCRRRSRSPATCGPPGRPPCPAAGCRRAACGGELGVHGVQVVAQRRPRHRLPAVVAGQREDPGHQHRQAEPLPHVEVRAGHLHRVAVVARGGLDHAEDHVRRRAHRHPDGELLRHALVDQARRAAARRRTARHRPSAFGSSAITFSTTTSKVSTTDSVSSPMRREFTSQREARSTRVRLSSRMWVCTEASSWLSNAATCALQAPGAEDLAGDEVGLGQLRGGRVGLPGQPVEVGDAGVVHQLVHDLRHHDLAAQLVLLHLGAVALAHLGREVGEQLRAQERVVGEVAASAGPRPARSWCRPAAPTARERSAPHHARAAGPPHAGVGSASSSRLSSPPRSRVRIQSSCTCSSAGLSATALASAMFWS